MVKISICCFFILLFARESFSQDTLTLTDVAQIQSNAQQLVVRDYKDFLNAIATESNQKTLSEMILNSFTEKNRIFDSSSVIIEDDVDPNHTAQTDRYDRKVKEYLDNLSLLYTKSNAPSIQFTLDKVSTVKSSKSRVYVKVYFSSFFGNKSKSADIPYGLNSRFAEVTVHKLNGDWAPTIAKIGFYNTADTVNDFANDIRILSDSTLSARDPASANKGTDFFEKRRTEKLRESVDNQNKIIERFDKLMDDGDNGYQKNDFDVALSNYRKAKEIKPYDKTVIARINMVLDQLDKENRSKSQSFDIYVQKAKEAKNKRDLATAIKNYRLAKDVDADKAAGFANELKELISRNDNLEDLRDLYKAGKYNDAINRYAAIIKKSDGISSAEKSDYYNGRGLCYEKTNDDKKALKDYTSAIDLDGDNVEAFINRAGLYKKNKQYLEAISDHRKAISRFDQNPLNYLELADLRVLNNQRKDAMEVLDGGLKIEALQTIPDLYFKRGQMLAEDKAWKKAIEDFSAVVATDPNNARGYYNRGLSYLEVKNVADAVTDFEKAKKKGLDSFYIFHINQVAEDNYTRSDYKSNQGALDSAIILVDYAIGMNPGNDRYRYARGNYLFSLTKYNDAIPFYDQATAINNSNADAYYKRGLCYHMLGNDKKAVEDLKGALAYNHGHYLATGALGDAYFSLGQFSDAAAQYQNALSMVGKLKGNYDAVLAELYNSLGKAFFKLGNYEQSTEAFKTAIKKNGNFADAYFNSGLSFYTWGRQEDAISNLSRAAELDNKNIYSNYYLAKAYQAAKKYPEAIQNYNSTLAKDSAHIFKDAVLNRGLSFYENRDFKSALRDYHEAMSLGLDSSNSQLNYQLGTIYLNQEPAVSDSALFYFGKQIARDSTDGNAAYGMGAAFVQKGRMDDALPWLDKALQYKAVTPKKLKNDRLIAAIQNDKRFKDLLKKY